MNKRKLLGTALVSVPVLILTYMCGATFGWGMVLGTASALILAISIVVGTHLLLEP